MITEWYEVMTNYDLSEGRGIPVLVTKTSSESEALKRVKGVGVQGGDGTIYLCLLGEDSNGIPFITRDLIYGRRQKAGGSGWEDGWLDYRDVLV